MKKLILMLLLVAGGVMSSSATDYYIGANEDGWKIKNPLTNDGNGTFSTIINLPVNYEEYDFTIFEGNSITWDNAFRPKDAGGDWGLNSNNTPTMVKKANNYVLKFELTSSKARALKIDFNPSTGAFTCTKLVVVASGKNGWSTTTDYLASTNNSEVYSGSVELEATSDGYDDGFKIVTIEGKNQVYRGYEHATNGDWLSPNGSNATVSYDGIYTITANCSSWAWVNPVIEKQIVKISNRGYTTFSSANALDLSGDDIYAYKAMEEHISNYGYVVKLTRVRDKVSAGTGLLLKGTVGQTTNLTLPVATSGEINNELTDLTKNRLKATVTVQDVTPQSGTSNYCYFLSYTDAYGIGFYSLENGKTYQSGAGKAYLVTASPLKDETQSGSGSRAAWIFEDDTTTGISAIKNEKQSNEVYNLNGQRVNNAVRGLYIVNGKKVIMK